MPDAKRGRMRGPPAFTSGRKSPNSVPQRSPLPQSPSFMHIGPPTVSPTQLGRQSLPLQSRLSTHALPSFGPPSQLPTFRATRRIVYEASADPKNDTTSASSMLESLWGSKIGGSGAPSGVKEPRAA